MVSFFYDTKKLRREFTETNMTNYGEFLAECFRSSNLHKDGWCESKVIDTNKDEQGNLTWIQIHLRWGLDEEGYKQEWYETLDYERDTFLREYDKNFPILEVVKWV